MMFESSLFLEVFDRPMATDDFFRARLDQMIDLRHPLAVLARRVPWSAIEASLAPQLAHRVVHRAAGGPTRTGRSVVREASAGPYAVQARRNWSGED